VTPDFVIHQLYPQNPGAENDARLLQSSTRWVSDAEKFRATLRSIYGAAHTNVELVCTENNSVSEKMGKQTTSLVNGLYLADSFGQMAQTEFNAFLWWDFRNMQEPVRTNGVSLYGWRPYGDHGMLSGHDTRYPHFYTFKLLKYFARGGDQIVRATSDNKLLAVYSAHRTNGALTLLIINKSPSATLTANFSLHNFEPASRAALFSYGIPQDEAARTGKGSQDIAETEIDGLRATFSHEFPPYSVSVIVLRK
jgi:hypothetical protein